MLCRYDVVPLTEDVLLQEQQKAEDMLQAMTAGTALSPAPPGPSTDSGEPTHLVPMFAMDLESMLYGRKPALARYACHIWSCQQIFHVWNKS